MRWLDYACGAGLLVLAALKAAGKGFGADLLVLIAAILELGLGFSFLIRRTPRVSASGLALLGAAFCVWTLHRGPEVKEARGCGCYGPYRLDFLPHLFLASTVLLLGGIQLLFVQRRERPAPAA